MPKFFTVTYDIVTCESAARGDCTEMGFVAPGGWHQQEREAMTLREASELLGICEDSGHWFTETDGRQDYQTGAVERRSLHLPDTVTGASYERIARLFCH